jgi:hypothetical protein
MKDNLNTKNKSTLGKDVETVSPVEELGVTVLSESLPKVSKRGRGRPPKAEVEKKLKPGKRGRPVGDYTKARELCARMLVSEGDRMLKTLINMALTDGHPNQIPALKMCLDRALPISYFESKDSNNAGGGVVINISGLTSSNIASNADSQTIDITTDVVEK